MPSSAIIRSLAGSGFLRIPYKAINVFLGCATVAHFPIQSWRLNPELSRVIGTALNKAITRYNYTFNPKPEGTKP